MSTLALVNITICLADKPLIHGLNLVVEGGSVTTVMGPSGSGKSSLLAYVCGTLPPPFVATGSISLNGRMVTELAPEKRRVGILFQDDLLFPHMSVADNLAFGLAPQIRGRAARRERVDAALAEADLEGMGDRDPTTLSGGQRARVAVMRTLLSEPQALLLDEPFGKLDAALRQRFRRFVFGHARANGIPTLLVTHDPADAESAEGPVLELSRLGETRMFPAATPIAASATQAETA